MTDKTFYMNLVAVVEHVTESWYWGGTTPYQAVTEIHELLLQDPEYNELFKAEPVDDHVEDELL